MKVMEDKWLKYGLRNRPLSPTSTHLDCDRRQKEEEKGDNNETSRPPSPQGRTTGVVLPCDGQAYSEDDGDGEFGEDGV